MAKSNRHRAQDKVQAAINNLTNAACHMEDVSDVYKDPVPDISQMLLMYQFVTQDMITGLERLKNSF